MFNPTLVNGLLIVTALGCGIIGGTFFAFSTFVMRSLGQLPAEGGIAAMNAINRVILRSLFMPVFVGTALLCILLLVTSAFDWSFSSGGPVVAGATLYIVASFISTIAFNVPMNERLASMEGRGTEANGYWAIYLKDWTFWNHVRTIASLAASGLFIWAMR
jgi:uncharacterized membrane protein